MIDVHCHLEQKDYENDLEEVINKCKNEGIVGIITSCCHPKDLKRSLEIIEKYKNYVFLSVGLHPEYIKEISEKEKDNLLDWIEKNKEKVVSIGEIGLDYFWVKKPEWREKQKELFRELLEFSREIRKPVTIHLRDAYEDGIKILEESGIEKVHLHMFNYPKLIGKIIENGWFVSINPIILRNKSHRKIAKKMPLEKLFLETDSPWNSPKRILEGIKDRNDPTSIRIVAQKIAEIKKIDFNTVWKQAGINAKEFFGLPINLF